MESLELKNAINAVKRGTFVTYGGNQMLSDNAAIRKYGCGIVAAADLFIYLHRYFSEIKLPIFAEIPKEGEVPIEVYNALLKKLNRSYFPIIPGFGVNNLVLVGGINLFFKHCAYPFKAAWTLTGAKRKERIEDMLSGNIPVIFTVGKDFPFLWHKHRLNLYSAFPDGSKRKTGSVKSHYMTITAIDDEWLTVSSWGRKYYVNLSEYEDFSRRYSNNVLCNIVYIK